MGTSLFEPRLEYVIKGVATLLLYMYYVVNIAVALDDWVYETIMDLAEALVQTSFAGDAETLRILLQQSAAAGVDPNFATEEGFTLLMHAINGGSYLYRSKATTHVCVRIKVYVLYDIV